MRTCTLITVAAVGLSQLRSPSYAQVVTLDGEGAVCTWQVDKTVVGRDLWQDSSSSGQFISGPPIEHSKQGVVYFVVGEDDSGGTLSARNATSGEEKWSAVFDGVLGAGLLDASANILFIGSSDLDATGEVLGSGGVHAWRVGDEFGSELWSVQFLTARFSSRGVLSEKGDSLYVPATDGALYCFNTTNGVVRWQQTHGAVFGPPAVLSTGGASLLVASVANATTNSTLFSLDAHDGSVKWSIDSGLGVTGAPLLSVDGGVVFVAGTQGGVKAFDSNDGSQIWAVELPVGGVYGQPALATTTGVLYVGTDSAWVYALDTTSDGDVVWSYDYTPEQLVITSTPTLNGNILLDAEELVLSIVLNSNFDFVYMIDAQTGGVAIDAEFESGVFHSIAGAHDSSVIYFGAANGFTALKTGISRVACDTTVSTTTSTSTFTSVSTHTTTFTPTVTHTTLPTPTSTFTPMHSTSAATSRPATSSTSILTPTTTSTLTYPTKSMSTASTSTPTSPPTTVTSTPTSASTSILPFTSSTSRSTFASSTFTISGTNSTLTIRETNTATLKLSTEVSTSAPTLMPTTSIIVDLSMPSTTVSGTTPTVNSGCTVVVSRIVGLMSLGVLFAPLVTKRS